MRYNGSKEGRCHRYPSSIRPSFSQGGPDNVFNVFLK
uniref:Uncharacterized protein n=1 Tax=Amphimedon queenslandica TaxID=400682 RepID=A0A1X7UVY0_AMPQE